MTKLGAPIQRQTAAAQARKGRAMWKNLQGGWTRKQWNYQCRLAARNYLLTHATISAAPPEIVTSE